MEAADGDTVFPSLTMLELFAHDESIFYVFLFNGCRFFITVTAKELEGEETLLQEFNEFKSDIDDPETMYNFEEWVLAPLDDFMQKVAPTRAQDARKPITLLEYFSPPTYAFRLVNRDGNLCPVREDFDPQVHGDTSPRTNIVEGSSPRAGRRNSGSSSTTGSLSDEGSHISGVSGVLYKSALPPVPIVSASQLERVDDGLRDEQLSDIPRKVRRVDTGEVFFFKAGFTGHGHLREIDILSQIARSDKVSPPFPTSRLEGLVVWGEGDDSTVLMGMLMNHIEGHTLAERMEKEPVATRLKWFRQVQATVKWLHDCGIVWGDVKPDNVIINANEDAAVVDFGGGYTPEYIAPELQQTMQGDLVGLDHMAKTMGIRHETR